MGCVSLLIFGGSIENDVSFEKEFDEKGGDVQRGKAVYLPSAACVDEQLRSERALQDGDDEGMLNFTAPETALMKWRECSVAVQEFASARHRDNLWPCLTLQCQNLFINHLFSTRVIMHASKSAQSISLL